MNTHPGPDFARRPASPGRIVIIGCGALKRPVPSPAASLYRGPYFASCLSAALAVAPRERCFILSARYGLLGLDDVIEPYDLTIGQPGAVTAGQLAAQAADRGITSAPVLALCSARYADLCRAVWSDVTAPLAGLGIGRQRHQLAVIREKGSAA